MIVGGAFAALARAEPDRAAVDDGTRIVTRGALLDAAARAALATLPGEIVAVPAVNSAAALAAILGTALAGGAAAVIDPAWPAVQRAAALDAIDPVRILEGPPAGAGRTVWPEIDPGAPFYVGFTSGTTGRPKPYRRSHRSWIETFRAGRAAFGLGAADVVLVAGPILHSLFLYAALDALDRGARIALLPRFTAQSAADALARGADRVVAVPTMIMALAAEGGCFAGVRTLLVGGARLDPAAEVAARRLFPAAEIVEFYGASELSFVAWRSSRRPAPAGSVGWPFPGVNVEIRDPSGRALPVGATGQIWVRSAMLALPGPSFRPVAGWASVGDLGALDASGALRLEGRAGEMIVSGGLNIHPQAVEAVLAGVSGVGAVFVCGRPDPYWGEAVVAVVEPAPDRPPPTRAGLVESCRAALPAQCCPRDFRVLAHLPRTPSGKIARGVLAARVRDGDPALEALA